MHLILTADVNSHTNKAASRERESTPKKPLYDNHIISLGKVKSKYTHGTMTEIAFIWYVRQDSSTANGKKRYTFISHHHPHEWFDGKNVVWSPHRVWLLFKLLSSSFHSSHLSNTFLTAQIVDKLIHILLSKYQEYTKHMSARFIARDVYKWNFCSRKWKKEKPKSCNLCVLVWIFRIN